MKTDPADGPDKLVIGCLVAIVLGAAAIAYLVYLFVAYLAGV